MRMMTTRFRVKNALIATLGSCLLLSAEGFLIQPNTRVNSILAASTVPKPSTATTEAEDEEEGQTTVFSPPFDEATQDIVSELDEKAFLDDNDDYAQDEEADDCSIYDPDCLSEDLLHFPTHSHPTVNAILKKTERLLRSLHKDSKSGEKDVQEVEAAKEAGRNHEVIYANNYVDFSKINTVGFDFDYTLATYTDELLYLIYDKALNRLVNEKQYPMEMLSCGLKYDPYFSIRGLAVDKETGWITHLSYTHKVAKAWEGRERLSRQRIFQEYRGKRALRPSERKRRLKPLNDLFSMAECCLIADTIQFFKDRHISYSGRNVASDVLKAISDSHASFEFFKLVAQTPEKYFEPKPHLKQVLRTLKESGKRLIFVSNTPFWYVDAGMRFIFRGDWIEAFDAVITSAGKPNFYMDEDRPFREVDRKTRRIMFQEVVSFERGKVYAEGCLKELARLLDWNPEQSVGTTSEMGLGRTSPTQEMSTSNVLYIGDSLFTDLVDAKREFGWTTAAVAPEVGFEMEVQSHGDFKLTQRSMGILLHALRMIQEALGTSLRTDEDKHVLDSLEKLVSLWRDRETSLLGSPFGSIFRARYQPSLFAYCLRRYCDLYMPSVSSLRFYSPQHRWYPEDHHRLAHETTSERERWTIEDVLETL